MKKRILRSVAVCLALLMLLLAMFGCNKNNGNGEQTNDTVGTSGTDESGPVSKVPSDLKFDGAEVILMASSHVSTDEFAPENNSAIIDAAVIKRNLMVEERLGIKLDVQLREEGVAGPYQDVIRNMILGGDGMADIVTGNAYYTSTLASEGLFYDFNTVDQYNYTSPNLAWYNQSFVNNIAYKNKLYFLVGDVTLGATDRAPVVFFNEDGLETWQIKDDIYEKALSGQWTIEYMKTLIKNVYSDIDSVEGRTKEDYYGLYFNGGSMAIDAMLASVGIVIAQKDANGDMVMSWGTSNDVLGFKAIYDLMYNTDGVYTGTVAGGTYYGETTSYFSEGAFFEGRALFATGMLSAAKNFALDPELHFGMLPLPKLDEAQPYRTTPQDGFTVMAIPHNIAGRLDIATATLETMSEYSYKEVRPVYYDTAYKIRYASSENTARLFDTVIESIFYDFGTFYSNAMGNPVHQLRNKLTGTGTTLGSNLMSVTAQHNSAMKLNLQKLLTQFDQNGN